MPFTSIRNVFAQAALATPDQFNEWSRAWRVTAESGSPEPLLTFFRRRERMLWR